MSKCSCLVSAVAARSFVECGYAVDIVAVRGQGSFRSAVPSGARLFTFEPFLARQNRQIW
ncbi:hypothetical protein [Nitrosomonas sp. Nm166]|uniref:hypothetical protein n=1 Tax=Nitrosomonas sp. Nm166 TaxID=1881054 RepID=UPI001160BAE3|nr:hypothetical protein [Nitrosomonas sp. Nm166]